MQIRYDDIRIEKKLLNKYIEEIKSEMAQASGLEDFSSYREQLELELREYLNADSLFLLDSGTSALQLSLMASGVRKGDSVIVPTVSNPATYAAVYSIGARPIYVDIDWQNLCLSSEELTAAIEDDTKAIIVVHLYGMLADIQNILQIARENDLMVIEDACQSFGSELNGQKSGTFGDFGVFSNAYYKTLSSIDGHGGILVCRGENYLEAINDILNSNKKYIYKFSDIPLLDSAVLRVKLRYIDLITKAKQKASSSYQEELSSIDEIHLFEDPEGVISVRQCFPVVCERAKELAAFLEKEGILQDEIYELFGGMEEMEQFSPEEEFPYSFKYREEVVLLPLFPLITQKEVKHTTELIKRFYSGNE